jgi:membrane peptidoglycan carboxypeptidase
VSSKADDFDVRYRDAGGTGHGRSGANGGYAGNVDYDLGYDANGWDTNGFRSPEADYLDSRAHATAAQGVGTTVASGRQGAEAVDTQEIAPPSREPELPGRGSHRVPEGRVPEGSRHGAHGGGPGGPGAPRGPKGPGGLSGPGRRGLNRPAGVKVKVKGSWWRHWTLRKALGVLLSCIGAVVVLGAVAVAVAYEETPVPTEAMAATGYTQSVVYSQNGTLIGRFGNTNRQMLAYSQIPQTMINAVLAAEDRNFFSEGGISPTGITRAAYEDVRGSDGSLQGGSTITQEFVRQYYSGIGTQQTFSRKIKEIFVAMKVGKEKSKQWILTNYLNTIYLGEGAYGVEAAAETYYGKPVSKLDVAQAAVIAAIIQQPSNYPLTAYRAQLKARWHYVLNGMVQMGNLTQQQAQTMKFPAPGDNVPQTVGTDVWDPYVLLMVYNELKDIYHFTPSQIDDGGYDIHTTIDDSKMAALYKAVSDNEAQMDASGVPFSLRFNPATMHASAVLEDPASGGIEALYPGPGYQGSKYNGTGRVISKSLCVKIHCQENMALAREQVGSSFKPYVLATAVKEGMNVRTSTLDGYNPLWIPPDNLASGYATSTEPANAVSLGYYQVPNDDLGENGPYTPQIAMAASINTAYAELWRVAGAQAVATMAQAFGVNTADAGITNPNPARGGMWYNLKKQNAGMWDEAGIALGQASLTVVEQATMLATIDDAGVYHDAHVVASITQANAPKTAIKITSMPVFSGSPMLNANEASQVQYAMSEDTASYGTAPVAAMSNGQEIIAKTGTTNTAQSAFFIGAVPSQALAVALFTDKQGKNSETLNGLGDVQQGGFGGTWPATIWHTYAEDKFVPLGIEPFPTPVFTGTTWNEVPPGLRKVAKKHKKPNHGNGNGNGNSPGSGNPNPEPTFSCDPTMVTCGTPGTTQSVNATQAGAAVGGIFAALPATCLWVRRRMRKRGPRRG